MMPGGYGKIVATEPADAKIRPILIRLLHQECSTIQPLQVFAPSGGFFCLLLGQIKKRAALAALFGESDASMRNFRDFFNVGFIDLLFDTICVFIAQQA